ncbi:carotenoid oxygenase family protein [Tautonia plasticadhaerens]|uniref:Carotenoid cleavage oxygenase n=1 Tax=Tautonia plasticadhaerens TaxID=2527974 RepID=A0A518H074_9BACT|nr:carotenoid oxygenase family protein [Tautonia plasticadhaerens]QDV34244.1 Carotenoid cleavage oxygenase [Tautonia plasticadhaerens]
MAINRRQFLRSAAVSGMVGVSMGRAGSARAEDGERAEWPDSPFLTGNYGPVSEEIEAEDLAVVGRIPEGLEGMFVRNGPNPQFPPIGNYHWFDGDGMLHGVLLRGGKASYRNRWVRTRGFVEERKSGKAIWGGLAEPPNMGLVARGKPMFKNAANTSVVWHDGKLMALWEGGEPHVISVPDLGTVGPYDFDGALRHAFTAHPKVDPVTGEMLCFGYQPVPPYLRYSVVDAEGTIRSTTAIDLPRPVMMHDFAVTDRHSIFMDLPATFDFARLLTGGPFLKYEPDLPSRFGILPRHGEGSEVKWFESPSCYVFHTLNAYEEGEEVVLVGCRYGRFPGALGMGGPPSDEHPNAPGSDDDAPRIYRWRFNLASGETREETLHDVPCEFPRINDARMGRPTRFGYAMEGEMGGFLKVDLRGGLTLRHRHGPGRLGGEGVFVPKPDATAEDDGWLITYVFDRDADTSEMVVVDTLAFDDDPVARVLIPRRIPYGFHGTWLPSDVLG